MFLRGLHSYPLFHVLPGGWGFDDVIQVSLMSDMANLAMSTANKYAITYYLIKSSSFVSTTTIFFFHFSEKDIFVLHSKELRSVAN